MKYLLLGTFCSLLFLPGCTGAQMENMRMQKVAENMKVTAAACLQKVTQNPEYAPLLSKTYFGTDGQFPLQMLTDKNAPTKHEISLLYAVHGDIQVCRKEVLDGAANMHPLILLALIEGYTAGDKLTADATTGKLTWGQINEGRKQILMQTQAKLIQAGMQISSHLENQHELELEHRQRAVEAFQQWQYQQQVLANQQQLISAANQPRLNTIHCS